MRRFRLLPLQLFLFALGVCAGLSRAGSVYVSPAGSDATGDGSSGNPYATLQHGIDAAAPGDTVVAQAGTYTGAGNRALTFGGKAVVLRGAAGAAATTIDCQGASPGLLFIAGESHATRVEDLTITGGMAQVFDVNDKRGAYGGAIYCEGTSTTLRRLVLRGNAAESTASNTPAHGGAIYAVDSTLRMEECVVEGNRTLGRIGPSPNLVEERSGGGGGIYFDTGTSATLYRCRIQGNTADDDITEAPTLGPSIFAANGGGIAARSMRRLALVECWIDGNTAGRAETRERFIRTGGGVYVRNSGLVINGSTISNNRIHWFGDRAALHISGHDAPAYPFIVRSTISDNDGYGVFVETQGTMVHCTVAGCELRAVFGRFQKTNCILSGAPYDPTDDQVISTGGGNIYDAGATFAIPSATDGTFGPLDYYGVPARLGPLQDNGGPTPTRLLLPGSPALDFGRGVTTESIDQRRLPRAFNADGYEGAEPDSGAVEMQEESAAPAITHVAVDGDDATADGSEEAPFATIQSGIVFSRRGGTVLIGPGNYQGDGNRAIQTLGKPFTLRSIDGPETTVIDAEYKARGIYIYRGETRETILDGLTIMHGEGQPEGFGAFNLLQPLRGGGILCEKASPTIRNCILRENRAIGRDAARLDDIPSPGLGGGLHCEGFAMPLVQDCLFTANFVIGGSYSPSPNYLAGGKGAAVCSMNDAAPTFERCIFRANVNGTSEKGSCGGAGAAIYAEGATVSVVDSLIEENSVRGSDALGICPFETFQGGAVAVYNAVANLSGTLIRLNDSVLNGAGVGANLHAMGGLSVVNCTFSENRTTLLHPGHPRPAMGGAIYTFGSASRIDFSTFVGNTSVGGASAIAAGYCTMGNCVLKGATGLVSPYIDSAGGNVLSDGSLGSPASGDLLNTDPLLGPLADNGGFTETHAIAPASPAIDHAVGAAPVTDQRGEERPSDGDGDTVAVADSGAFEYINPSSATGIGNFLLGKKGATGSDLNGDGAIDVADLIRARLGGGVGVGLESRLLRVRWGLARP